MDFKQIDGAFAVAGQITESDLEAVKRAGFKGIICNRPDNEMGAVPHQRIAQAAKAHGLEFRFVPITGPVSQEDLNSMASAVRDLPQPVLGYCRSGMRSANMYMLARQYGGL
jgi:uncharacterized protein (TIGR01244 family)